MSIYCDINTLGAVEHSRSQRNISATPCVSLRLLSCSTAPSVFTSQNIDTGVLLYPLNIDNSYFFSADFYMTAFLMLSDRPFTIKFLDTHSYSYRMVMEESLAEVKQP